MKLLAPAKINLHLRIGAVRSDGFHPLLSWMTTVGLFDTIWIDQAQDSISLSCDDAKIACDASNLVIRAAETMQSLGPRNRGLKVKLSKRIPVGGGLGGGSSDAARMLLGLNHLWQLNRTTAELVPLAAKLGSDVPFFLHGPSSVCSGRGEIVEPIDPPKCRWAVLALPEIAMPTVAVYAKFDALGPGKDQQRLDQPMWREWASEWITLDAQALLPRLINDLEAPAFAIAPQLGRLREELESSLGRIVRMSGSGSTLFTLFDSQHEADEAVRKVTHLEVRALSVPVSPAIDDDLKV